MKIIYSALNIPTRSKRVDENRVLQLDISRPYFDKDTTAFDECFPLCKTILEKSNIEASELDLILTINLGIDNAHSSKDVIGTKYGFPLKKKLKATKAVVFDLLDSDWNSALMTAKSFAFGQNIKYVLIVRCDYDSSTILPDENSGFMMPDGAAVILVELTENIGNISFKYIDQDKFDYRMSILSEDKLLNNTFRGKYDFLISDEYVDHVKNVQNEILQELLQDSNNVGPIIFENWFPWESTIEHVNKELFIGDFFYALPKYLQKIKSSESVANVTNVCYYPRMGRFSISTINL